MAHPARDLHTMINSVMSSGNSNTSLRWKVALEAVGREPSFEQMQYAAHCLFETGRLGRAHLPAAMLNSYELVEPAITRLVFMQHSTWGSTLQPNDHVSDVGVAVLDSVAEYLEAVGGPHRNDVPRHSENDVIDARGSVVAASKAIIAMPDVDMPVKYVIVTRLSQVDAALAQLEFAGPDQVRTAVAALEGEVHIAVPRSKRQKVLAIIRPAIVKTLKVVGTLGLHLGANYAVFHLGLPQEVLELVNVPTVDFIYDEEVAVPQLEGGPVVDGEVEEEPTSLGSRQ